MLEVGCGKGALASVLAQRGYDVLAIDPEAPDGAIFRRIKLEALPPHERFDGVVASRSFHHMHDLDANVARVAAALEVGGPFVLEELAWDLIDDTTADWYEGQRRVLVAAGRNVLGPRAADWRAHHRDTFGVHAFRTLYDALRFRFTERHFEGVPYLWRYLGGDQSLQLAETLIRAGAIRPLGFRFVGIPRSDVR